MIEGVPKAPFSRATIPRCREDATPFPGLLHFTLDPYFIMLSVMQGGIKYQFLSFRYDSTLDWTLTSWTIAETLLIKLELPNLERISKLVKNYKYLGIFEMDTIKQLEMKEEKKEMSTSDERENYSKSNSSEEISSKV